MNSFKKILVPIDGSKYSDKALQKATEIVKEFYSKIILIYVIEKSLPLDLLDRSEYLRINRKFGKNVLDKAKSFVFEQGIHPEIVLKEGNIVNEIEKVAKKEKCDMIIVGNKGLGAMTRFLLGSISNKLAHTSQCSVLIVK